MDELKRDPQPQQPLSPEQQLDLLLEKFLDDDTPPVQETELPVQEDDSPSAEDQLDLLLASFQDISTAGDAEDPAPVQESATEAEEMPPLTLTDNEAEQDPSVPPANAAEILPETAETEETANGIQEDSEAEAKELAAEDAVDDPLLATLLLVPEVPDAIGPDEQAVEDAGLTHPEDLEFEQILEQTMQEQQPEDSSAETETEQSQENTTTQADPPAITTVKEENDMSEEDTPAKPEEEEKAKPEPSVEPSEEPEPPKKRRPKNTKAYGFFGIPHLLSTVIWLGIIVFIGVGLGKFIWNCAADVLALGRPDTVVFITITEDDDLDSIAEKLKTTGLIRYPSLFKLYGQISDAMDSIRTGTYELNTLFDYHALVESMGSNQRRKTTSVTIPEGYTCAQIFQLLETKGVTTVEKLEAAAASSNLGDYWFLEGVERGAANCLEGYLFPDTYTFYLDHDPVGVLQKFLNNFNKRFNESMKIKLDTLNLTLADMMRANGQSEEYIAEHQMTVREVVIIASMIEKETATNPESYSISSVIYNRLTNPNGETAGFLQIDATLVYINGGKTPSNADKQIDSPYNTYLYKGLPAGAISNPGSYSLDAALDPAQTEYYFYALDPSIGEHHFSKTLKEHNDFLESIRKEEPDEESQE